MRRTLLPLVALLAFPVTAQAQTVSVANERSLPRLDRSGALVAKRPLTQNPEGVNRQDCLDDQRIRFSLQLAGFEANASLAGWASVSGVDCAQPANRAGQGALCWSIAPTIPLQQQVDVDVPVRTLLAGAQTEPVADDRLCGAVDLTSLDVQFLYFSPGDVAVPAVKKSLTVVVDTIGPEPPAGIRALPGDARTTVQWDATGNAITAMNVYCAPSPGTDLARGMLPTSDFDARLRCASVVGSTATSAVVTQTAAGAPLANGETYAFAVSGVDAFGNAGPLSERTTAAPAPGASDDDGGGCTVARGRGGSSGGRGHGSALAVALGALVALRRRRVR